MFSERKSTTFSMRLPRRGHLRRIRHVEQIALDAEFQKTLTRGPRPAEVCREMSGSVAPGRALSCLVGPRYLRRKVAKPKGVIHAV